VLCAARFRIERSARAKGRGGLRDRSTLFRIFSDGGRLDRNGPSPARAAVCGGSVIDAAKQKRHPKVAFRFCTAPQCVARHSLPR
jgi:hypothetical protein